MHEWPEHVVFAQVPSLVGGHINKIDDDCPLHLETVDPREIRMGEDSYFLQPCSGREFDDSRDPTEYEEYPEEYPDDYAPLEDAMRSGTEIPPVLLRREKSGHLTWFDGWHRIAIALHLGWTEILAYVIEADDWRQS